MALAPVDLIVGPPLYETLIEFEVVAQGGVSGAMVEDAFADTEFLKQLNETGLMKSFSINITDREVISSPIPPPPPPPLKILNADEVHSMNVSTSRLTATGDASVDGKLMVGGNASFVEDVAVAGRVAAGSMVVAEGVVAGGGGAFGGDVSVNRSLRVAAPSAFLDDLSVFK